MLSGACEEDPGLESQAGEGRPSLKHFAEFRSLLRVSAKGQVPLESTAFSFCSKRKYSQGRKELVFLKAFIRLLQNPLYGKISDIYFVFVQA